MEVGDKRVSKWIRDNRPEKRKRIKRKKKGVGQLYKLELFRKNKHQKKADQQAPDVHKVDSDETESE